MVRLMVGRELRDYYHRRRLDLARWSSRSRHCARTTAGSGPTTLSVRRGEIVGVAGLAGSGKAEFGLALAGAIPCEGTVRVLGRAADLSQPRSALASGIGFVPADRKRAAMLPTRSVAENSPSRGGASSRAPGCSTRALARRVRAAISATTS